MTAVCPRICRFRNYRVSHTRQSELNGSSAGPRKLFVVHEGGLGDAVAVVGGDNVGASPLGNGVARPLGVLRVEELQLSRPRELVVCGTGDGGKKRRAYSRLGLALMFALCEPRRGTGLN